jgi:hypothetical protein
VRSLRFAAICVSVAAFNCAAAQAQEAPLDAIQKAIQTHDRAGVASLASELDDGDTGSAISAGAFLTKLSGCALADTTPSRGGIGFLHYTCEARHKAASDCLSGDLTVWVDFSPGTRRLMLVEKRRTDIPACRPSLPPPPLAPKTN